MGKSSDGDVAKLLTKSNFYAFLAAQHRNVPRHGSEALLCSKAELKLHPT